MNLQSFLKKYDIAIESEHDNCENPGLVYKITNKRTVWLIPHLGGLAIL